MTMAELVLSQTAAEQERMGISDKRQQTKHAVNVIDWETVWF